ncbi:hypothetical protein ASF51_14355 [Agreia sp. Leaf283]|nr:hypothetical protein ASF51_14355 [Agreia sp. Leaf283]
MLAAGASAYVSPRPMAAVAASVKARLAERDQPMLDSSSGDENELAPRAQRHIGPQVDTSLP